MYKRICPLAKLGCFGRFEKPSIHLCDQFLSCFGGGPNQVVQLLLAEDLRDLAFHPPVLRPVGPEECFKQKFKFSVKNDQTGSFFSKLKFSFEIKFSPPEKKSNFLAKKTHGPILPFLFLLSSHSSLT